MIIYLLYTIFIAILWALLEIQIEGKDGWAKNLPTWRKKIKIISPLFDNQSVTGYHLYLNLFILAFFHFPLLMTGWTLKGEFLILGLFFFAGLAEDFAWFVLNPHYGIKNFKKGKIAWRPVWWGPIPRSYYINALIVVIFLLLSYFQ